MSYDLDKRFLSVVIKLPDNEEDRKTIVNTLGFGNKLHGARLLQ